MILVPNHQRRLSGSKLLLVTAFLLFISGCTPRFSRPKPPTQAPDVEELPVEEVPEEEEEIEVPFSTENQIALLLPFQLAEGNNVEPSNNEIQRAALALDFYQGFKMGLDALAERGSDFQLNVLDTRDNESENIRIAQLAEVQEAALIVGPVFPKEIHAFGSRPQLGNALQISPLAATTPSDFGNPNLVTLTAPLSVHTHGLAEAIAKNYKSTDVIMLYNVGDASSKQFLPLLRAELNKLSPNATVVEVDDLQDLADRSRVAGTNHIVCGSVNKYQITPLLNRLSSLVGDLSMDVRLYGHPNWEKLDFEAQDGLDAFKTRITSSYYINSQASDVRQFGSRYRDAFGIEPSEFAFKGYDAAYYFGSLLAKYGRDYREYITHEEYDGMHNTFKFGRVPGAGFVNNHVSILEYRQGDFRLVN